MTYHYKLFEGDRFIADFETRRAAEDYALRHGMIDYDVIVYDFDAYR